VRTRNAHSVPWAVRLWVEKRVLGAGVALRRSSSRCHGLKVPAARSNSRGWSATNYHALRGASSSPPSVAQRPRIAARSAMSGASLPATRPVVGLGLRASVVKWLPNASNFPPRRSAREAGTRTDNALSHRRAHRPLPSRCARALRRCGGRACGRETPIQSSRAVGLRRGWMKIHPAHTSKNVLQGQLNFAVVDSCAGDLTESPVPQASVRFGKLGRVERVEEFNTEL
jgi:hypothetical protein